MISEAFWSPASSRTGAPVQKATVRFGVFLDLLLGSGINSLSLPLLKSSILPQPASSDGLPLPAWRGDLQCLLEIITACSIHSHSHFGPHILQGHSGKTVPLVCVMSSKKMKDTQPHSQWQQHANPNSN